MSSLIEIPRELPKAYERLTGEYSSRMTVRASRSYYRTNSAPLVVHFGNDPGTEIRLADRVGDTLSLQPTRCRERRLSLPTHGPRKEDLRSQMQQATGG